MDADTGVCEFCNARFARALRGRPARFCVACRESRVPYRWEEFHAALNVWLDDRGREATVQLVIPGTELRAVEGVRGLRSLLFGTANEVRAVEQRVLAGWLREDD